MKPDQILPISGVGALTDALTWCICGDGEGILVPQPLYAGFQFDIPSRSRGVIVPVGFKGLDGYHEKQLDAIFDEDMNSLALERALAKSRMNGTTVRAVLITKYVKSFTAHWPTNLWLAVQKVRGIKLTARCEVRTIPWGNAM